MAEIVPIFEKTLLGSGSMTSESWVDLGTITTGKQWWIGYATFIASGKNLKFELRPNLPGQSTGTTGTTQLRSFSSVPGDDSKDVDLYFYGNIIMLAPPTAAATGVEKLWLRVSSGSGSAATFDYIINYTEY